MCDELFPIGTIIRRAGLRWGHAFCLTPQRENLPIVERTEYELPRPKKRPARVVRWTDLMGREHTDIVE